MASMFGSPPPEESLAKIERYIRNLSESIIVLERLKDQFNNERPKPENFNQLNTQFNNHLINLKNSRTLLEDAKEPGFFAMLRRGSQIMEVQLNPDSSNTKQSIQAAQSFVTQVNLAIQNNHAQEQSAVRAPSQASPMVVSSRERRGAVDPITHLTDIFNLNQKFYNTKLDGKIPDDPINYKASPENNHLIQYDNSDLRKDITARCANILNCINNLGDKVGQNAAIIDKLSNLREQLLAANSAISNLDPDPNKNQANKAQENPEPQRPQLR